MVIATLGSSVEGTATLGVSEAAEDGGSKMSNRLFVF
jgi:hypothetical protein